MAEELTQSQKEKLRGDLLALKDALIEGLERSRAASAPVELDQAAVGRVSRIDAIGQQQMSAAARRAQQLRLEQVNAALAALKRDEYGLCRSCEEPIGVRRLTARPEAPLCLLCASQREA